MLCNSGRSDSDETTPEQLSLQFHKTHGCHVKMSADMRTATRVKGSDKAVCFSNRPVVVRERIHVEILDTTDSLEEAMRIGFTHFNPAEMDESQIPTAMWTRFKTRPGYWTTDVMQDIANKGNVFSFYATRAGGVTYQKSGKVTITFNDFDPSPPMWAVIDVFGNTTSVKIVGEL